MFLLGQGLVEYEQEVWGSPSVKEKLEFQETPISGDGFTK
jgi:hypothetical protein